MDPESINSLRGDSGIEQPEWMDWDGLDFGGVFSEEEELESEVESLVVWDGERGENIEGKVDNEFTDESEKLKSPRIDVDQEDFEEVDGGDEDEAAPPHQERDETWSSKKPRRNWFKRGEN